MSISVRNISKRYGQQKALDNVSLEIKPGEIVGLLGPNGAGKSTLMKILSCFLPPSSGEASVCGHDVLEQSMEVRKKVGYLPENNPLYLDLYVREFLDFIAGLHGLQGPRQKIHDIIHLTGLQSEQNKIIGALSKGYRQRVGLAQTLIHDPEVLILDEPTSGLDPNQLLEIRSLIKETGRAKTVMLSTHIMQEVEAICDRAIIIHQGRIVADDTTHNLQRLSTSKAIIQVEFSSAVAAELLLTIPGILEVFQPAILSGNQKKHKTQGESKIWQVTSHPANDIRADIFQFAVAHHLTVLSLHREEQKMEDVFQELTKNIVLP